MRGLEKDNMKRGHQTDRQTDLQTLRLLDQLGRVGENSHQKSKDQIS